MDDSWRNLCLGGVLLWLAMVWMKKSDSRFGKASMTYMYISLWFVGTGELV